MDGITEFTVYSRALSSWNKSEAFQALQSSLSAADPLPPPAPAAEPLFSFQTEHHNPAGAQEQPRRSARGAARSRGFKAQVPVVDLGPSARHGARIGLFNVRRKNIVVLKKMYATRFLLLWKHKLRGAKRELAQVKKKNVLVF